MAYCGGATEANAQYLASKTGLNPNVALAWLKNECQATPNPTNPLNIDFNGAAVSGADKQVGKLGPFAVYNTTQAGLDAAANQINHSAYYSGIRTAIRSGNPWAQAQAIQNSPWAGGHYGYSHIVNALSSILGQAAPAGYTGKPGGTTTLPPTTVSVPGSIIQASTTMTPISADQWNAFIACVTSTTGTIRAIGSGNIPTINSCAASNHIDFAKYGVDPSQFVGKSLTDLLNAMVTQGAVPGQNLGTLIPDIPGAISTGVNGIIAAFTMLGALILILFGLWLFSKGKRQQVEVSQAPGPSRLGAAASDAGELAAG
jgi:hypothetical protein